MLYVQYFSIYLETYIHFYNIDADNFLRIILDQILKALNVLKSWLILLLLDGPFTLNTTPDAVINCIVFCSISTGL